MWKLPADAQERIKTDGYLICSIDSDALDTINSEFKRWRDVPAINGYGEMRHSGDALIQNAAIYAPSALRAALEDTVLEFAQDAFGEEPILSKIEYRRALQLKPEMPLHCDPGHDLLVFVYLNGVSAETGSTFVIPETHSIGLGMNDGYVQVPQEAEKTFGKQRVIPSGPPGTCVIIAAGTWHGRTPTDVSGREILWFSYVPKSHADEGVNLVLSSNCFVGLSQRQVGALGLGMPRCREAEDFRLSRTLTVDSTAALPLPYLLKTTLRRTIAELYSRIPSPIRRAVRAATAPKTLLPLQGRRLRRRPTRLKPSTPSG